MMTPSEVAEHVVQTLHETDVPFLLVGSFSSNQYGIPRSTKDIDVVVQAQAGRLRDFTDLLGPEFVAEEQFRFETNTGTVCQEFSVKGCTMKVEIFTLSEDPHDQERFSRRVEHPLFDMKVPFPTAEDVIVWKLRWARPKGLEDVRGVILVQNRESELDWEYIRSWCEKHETLARLKSLIASLPEVPAGWQGS